MPKSKTSTIFNKKDDDGFENVLLSEFVEKKQDKSYTAADYSVLNLNEHYRYEPNSKHIGHAILGKNTEGEKIAWQYQIPASTNQSDPVVFELSNIEEFKTKYGHVRYKGIGSNGKEFYATRYDHAKIKTNEDDDAASVDIAYFSEAEEDGKQPFWGSVKPVKRFRDDLPPAEQAEIERELLEVKKIVKGGEEIVVDFESVHHRDKNAKRTPDQNTVMGESARDAFENFYATYKDEISPEFAAILKKAFSIKKPTNARPGQYRPEWLHAYGFSLLPTHIDPQRSDNLGAASKWANTEMMILERVAKWFALNQNPEDPSTKTRISIKTLFDMLMDSELVDHIRFEVNLELRGRMIRFIQDLDTFKSYPVFRKASDLAQATGISYAVLHDQSPLKIEKVKTLQSAKTPISKPQPETASHESQVNKNTKPNKKASQPTGGMTMPKDRFPTHIKMQDSIVKVYTTAQEPDYTVPWHGTEIVNWTGSGSVIQHGDKKYVLTNAHCEANGVRTQVRLANHQKKFNAKPICISYQADLALLEVEDGEFQKLAKPVELGDVPSLQNEIEVVGFPMGGHELSITKGIVSRIEVNRVEISATEMLQIQVDAAINCGNSGGAAFSNDKLVGIPFQGDDDGENLGYIIPMPIVKHFLAEAFSGRPYKGFPVLPIEKSNIANEMVSKFYGMKADQTGIIVSKVAPTSCINGKIKPNDIILEIEGYKLSNIGQVDIPGVGKCIDYKHIIHMKNLGDIVKLKILRDKKEMTTVVKLDSLPFDKLLVPEFENDKMPNYYLNSGFVFIPVSINYLTSYRNHPLMNQYVKTEEGISPILSAFKKNPDEQLVAIAAVLDCDNTEGYDELVHNLVSKINGKPINNFKELVEIMDACEDEMFVMETYDKQIVPFANFDKRQLKALMKQYKIPFDRSEDLRPDSPTPSPVQATVHHDEPVEMAVDAATEASSSSEEVEVVIPRARRSNAFKGMEHFNDAIKVIAAKAKAAKDDDELFDFDNISNQDEEEDDDDFKPNQHNKRRRIDSDDEAKPSKPVLVKSGHSMFSKRQHEEKSVAPEKKASGWFSKPKKDDEEEKQYKSKKFA